jgi:hypothetical protein
MVDVPSSFLLFLAVLGMNFCDNKSQKKVNWRNEPIMKEKVV